MGNDREDIQWKGAPMIVHDVVHPRTRKPAVMLMSGNNVGDPRVNDEASFEAWKQTWWEMDITKTFPRQPHAEDWLTLRESKDLMACTTVTNYIPNVDALDNDHERDMGLRFVIQRLLTLDGTLYQGHSGVYGIKLARNENGSGFSGMGFILWANSRLAEQATSLLSELKWDLTQFPTQTRHGFKNDWRSRTELGREAFRFQGRTDSFSKGFLAVPDMWKFAMSDDEFERVMKSHGRRQINRRKS